MIFQQFQSPINKPYLIIPIKKATNKTMIHRAEKGVDQIRKKVIIRKTKSRRRKKKIHLIFQRQFNKS